MKETYMTQLLQLFEPTAYDDIQVDFQPRKLSGHHRDIENSCRETLSSLHQQCDVYTLTEFYFPSITIRYAIITSFYKKGKSLLYMRNKNRF